MPTLEKAKTIERAREWYGRSSGVVFADYRGLTVKEMQTLRRDLRARGGEIHVLKNTLFRLAAGEDAGSIPAEMQNGTTAFAFVYENESEVAKALLDYARTSRKLVVKGGFFGGRSYSPDQVETLSRLPSREVLIAQLLGAIAAPLSGLVSTVEAIYAGPIRAIGALADQRAKEQPAETGDPHIHGYTSSTPPPTPAEPDFEGGVLVQASDDAAETGEIVADPSASAPIAVNEPTVESRPDLGPLPEAGGIETGADDFGDAE